MVLPAHMIEALNEGDVSAVVAWLDGGGDVNDTVFGHTQYFMEGDTMLMAVAQVESFTRAHIALAKLLLQRGADVNRRSGMYMGDGFSAIHCCLDGIRNAEDPHRPLLRELLGIYMAAGADLTAMSAEASGSFDRGHAPLGMALERHSWYQGGTNFNMGSDESKRRSAFETVKLLLRHGASIDACAQEPDPTHYVGEFAVTAEEMLRRTEAQDRLRAIPYNLAACDHFIACQALVSDVRAAGGTCKQYVLHMPKALLRLRSLVARGRARSVKRLRARTPREIELLFAPAFPNELCWRVLEYWNPRYEARRTPSP